MFGHGLGDGHWQDPWPGRLRSLDPRVRPCTILTGDVHEAATRTLDHFGTPKTAEGQEARNALLMQQSEASRDVAALLKESIENAQVFQGGGQAIDEGSSLEDRLRKAAADGAARLFHKFSLADSTGWPQAYQDAAKGLVNALERSGHMTPAETHPMALEVFAFLGSGSFKGLKLRERFMGTPYGWSNEAVNAVLAVLFSAGQLKVTAASGQPVAVGKFLERDVNQYARKLEPKGQQVQVPSRMVRTEAELDAWLADVRAAALAKLQMGPVQL